MTENTHPVQKSQIISAIYFYSVLFLFSIIAFISAISLILTSTLKSTFDLQPTSLFGSSLLSYGSAKDLDGFKRECKNDITSYSSSTFSSYSPTEAEKKAQVEKQAQEDKKLEDCANNRLSNYNKEQSKAESDKKKSQDENKANSMNIAIIFLSASIVCILLHLLSFKLIRKIFS